MTGCSFLNCPDGCCDGVTCQKQNNATYCGLYGAKCKKCSSYYYKESCVNGICNDGTKCNASKCSSGCCKNSLCTAGNQDDACGKGGAVCTYCPPYDQCSGQKCTLKKNSNWRVTLVSVEVSTAKKWDTWSLPGFEAPDVYVELTVGGVTKKSKTVDNKYTPQFNEYLMTATAQNLMGTVKIKVMDYDPIPPAQEIASCTTLFFESEIHKGEAKIYYCGSGSDLKKIVFKFAPAP